MSNGTWVDGLKTLMQSQVGGWIMACVIFAVLARWVIQDRSEVYHDLKNLREKVTPMIVQTEETVLRNEKLLQEIAKKVGANPNP